MSLCLGGIRLKKLTKEQRERLLNQAILNNCHEGFYYKDLDSKFIAVSEYMLRNFGLKNVEEIIGKSDFDFFTKEHATQAYEDEQEIIRSGKPKLGVFEKETYEGDKVAYVVTSKYPLYDGEDNIIGTWGHTLKVSTNDNSASMLTKIRNLEHSNKRLEKANAHDHLTGLYSVKVFYEMMEEKYKEALENFHTTDDLCLIMLDVDDFKEINDRHGHLAGDAGLVFFSNIIKESIRDNDVAFRYGGDEFVIICHISHRKDAIDIANRIIKQLKEEHCVYKDICYPLQTSVGISFFKEVLPYGDSFNILQLADARLYEAKKQKGSFIVTIKNE